MVELDRAVLDTPGAASVTVRHAAFTGSGVPDTWAGYVNKVREMSYRVSDADIEDLRAVGESEDAIFEITLAAALGAARRRLDAGLRALREPC